MGQTAPVGSVVITQRQAFADVAVGDVITVVPPASTSYITHRVVEIDPQGFLRTQGDINPDPDTWLVSPRQYVGTVSLVVPGLGWLLRGLPWLFTGWLAVWLLASFVKGAEVRWHTRMLGNCLVFSVVALIVRPWTRVQTLGSTPSQGDSITANLVATGALPTRVSPAHGDDSVRLLPGQTGLVTSDFPNAAGVHQFVPTISLFGWWLVGVALLCLVPLLHIVVVGTPIEDRWASRQRAPGDILPTFPPMPSLVQVVRNRIGSIQPPGRTPTVLLGGVLGGAALPVVWLSGPPDTSGATTLTIANPDNRAGTAAIQNCQDVWASHPNTQLAYTLVGYAGTEATNGKAEPDIRPVASNDKIPGTYVAVGPYGAGTQWGSQRDTGDEYYPCQLPAASLIFSGPQDYGSTSQPVRTCLTTGQGNVAHAQRAFVPLGNSAKLSADLWFRAYGPDSGNGLPLLSLSANADSWGTSATISDGSNHVDQPLRLALELDGDLQLSVIKKDDSYSWADSSRLRHQRSAVVYQPPSPLYDRTWHHLAITHDQTTDTTLVYLDAVEVIRFTSSDTFGDNAGGYWRVGCQYIQRKNGGTDYSSYFHASPSSQYPSTGGQLPDIAYGGYMSLFAAFKDYVLTPQEISYRYNSRNIS